MLKRHIKYTIRQWWPMLLILGLFMTFVFSFSCLSWPTSYSVRELTDYNGDAYTITDKAMQRVSPALLLLLLGVMASLVMPFFVFSYRTKKQRVDVFYQASYGPTTIRRVRLYTGLAILSIALTAAFLTGFAIYVIRFLGTPASLRLSNSTRYRLDINLGAFVLAYLLALIVMVAQYFINCFLVGLGNYFLDQLFLLLFGNLFLGLCILSPLTYLLTGMEMSGGVSFNWVPLLIHGLSPAGAISVGINAIDEMANGAVPWENVSDIMPTHAFIATVAHFSFGAVLGVAVSRLKDPSGEYADVAGARNKAIGLIPHGAALVLGILLSMVGILSHVTRTTTFFVLPFFVFNLYAIGYYVLLALWRHRFKMARFDLIVYLCVVGTVFMLLVGMICLGETYYPYAN